MFPSAQSLLACLMIAIVCILAALYVSQHLCTSSPSNASDYACHAGVVILFLLVFVHLCRCVRSSDQASIQAESFATIQDWGSDPSDDDVLVADFNDEHVPNIVGPDPKRNELHTWQYNPQNTLVDYKFYEKDKVTDDASHRRLAPLASGSIGRRNGDFVKTPDVYACSSTRNPSLLSNSQEYVTNSTASNAPPVTQTVRYKWCLDGQSSPKKEGPSDNQHLIGPKWTYGEIEPPAGKKNMGSWTAAVYTPEQQKNLGVDEYGDAISQN